MNRRVRTCVSAPDLPKEPVASLGQAPARRFLSAVLSNGQLFPAAALAIVLPPFLTIGSITGEAGQRRGHRQPAGRAAGQAMIASAANEAACGDESGLRPDSDCAFSGMLSVLVPVQQVAPVESAPA
jgi:hypothetical protein